MVDMMSLKLASKTQFVLMTTLSTLLWFSSTGMAQGLTTPSTKIVVARLSGLGVDPEVMKRLEDYLRGEISRIPGFTVVGRAEQEKRLAKARGASADCHGQAQCLTKLATLFSADYAVQGTVASFSGKIKFNVKVVRKMASAKARLEVREDSGTLEGQDENLIPGVRLIAYRLFAPQLIKAYVKIEVAMSGVEVEIDGRVVGMTPFAEPIAVEPGQHFISLRRVGFEKMELEVNTHPFQITVINAVPSKRKDR